RLARERQIVEELEVGGPGSAGELTGRVYAAELAAVPDGREQLLRAAEMTLRAHLRKLPEEGRVREEGDRFGLLPGRVRQLPLRAPLAGRSGAFRPQLVHFRYSLRTILVGRLPNMPPQRRPSQSSGGAPGQPMGRGAGSAGEPLRYGTGSYAVAAYLTSKWRCGPLELPVEPTKPITSPAWTCWPQLTAWRTMCP